MTLQDAMNDYLAFITHERGLAKTTRVGSEMYLRHLLRWMETNGYPSPALSDFNTAVLRRFLYHPSSQGKRPRTIRGTFYPVRALGDYLVDHH